MKKLTILCAALLLAVSAFAEKGHIFLASPSLMQVSAISPNGKWACGYIGDATSMIQGALWNLETDEVIYLSSADESTANDVTDEGVVVGSFTSYNVLENGAGVKVAGWYKDGQWHEFDNSTIEGVMLYNCEAYAVTNDGSIAVGYAQEGKKYVPVKWVDGELELIFPHDPGVHSVCYTVSGDGKYAAGWTEKPDDDGDLNRTIALWTDTTVTNLSKSPTFAEAGRKFSPDGKLLLCETFGINKFYYNVETKEIDSIPPVSMSVWNFLPTYITNDGQVFGGETMQDMMTQMQSSYGYVYDGTNAMKFNDWVKEKYNVEIDDMSHMITRVIELSDDGSVIALLDYPKEDGMIIGEHASLILKLNQEVTTPTPASLNATKIKGTNNVRLTWKAPLVVSQDFLGFNLYRGEELIQELTNELAFVDKLENEGTYTYVVTAVYDVEDTDVESEKTTTATIVVGDDVVNKVNNLDYYAVNYNDIKLAWSAPNSNLPSVEYYDVDDNFAGFGGGINSFRVAIQMPNDMVNNYAETHSISRVSFMPRNKEAIYTIKININDEEVYSQTIEDNATLRLGEHNIIDLNTPVAFEADDKVLVVIDINADNFTVSSNDIIGMIYGKAVYGYTDLVCLATEEDFYSLGERSETMGMGEMNISWAISAIFSTVDENNKPQIDVDKVVGYEVYRDETKVATVTNTSYQDNNLESGEYTYGVAAVYADNSISEVETVTIDFAPKAKALVSIDEVKITPEPTFIEASWEAPLNNDRTHRTYALGASSGQCISQSTTDLIEYTVGAIYTPEYLKWQAGYTIDALTFYPTNEAEFMLILEVDGEDEQYIEIGQIGEENGYVIGEWNEFKLEEPVTIKPNSYYAVKLLCSSVDPTTAPVTIDNQPGVAGVSDLFCLEYGYTSQMSSTTTVDLIGSWMIGMIVHNDNTETLPVEGYNVEIDGEQVNNSLVEATTFKHEGTYTEGDMHRLKINTVYSVEDETVEVEGKVIRFNIAPASVESIEIDRVRVYPNPATSILNVEGEVEKLVMVDMNGRVVAESDNNILDVTSLPVANYVLNIYNNGVMNSVKVVVVR